MIWILKYWEANIDKPFEHDKIASRLNVKAESEYALILRASHVKLDLNFNFSFHLYTKNQVREQVCHSLYISPYVFIHVHMCGIKINT